ncbi:MAG: ATP-binding protein [Armatimonadota bacterium]|nr:ATP-binding protein [Armatimonadota bacterium]
MRHSSQIPPLSRKPNTDLLLVLVGIAVLAFLLWLSCKFLTQWHCAVICCFLVLVAVSHLFFIRRRERLVRELVHVLRRILSGAENPSAASAALRGIGLLGTNLASAVDDLGTMAKSLHDEKRQADLIISNMTDGIIAVNARGLICLVNRAAAEMLGIKESDVLGAKPVDTDLHPEIIRLLDECVSHERALTAEIQLPGQPPRVLGLRAVCSGRRPDATVRAFVIIDDLTQIRRHERVQEEFLSNVSHELRTPLTAIRTTAEALMSGAKNDTVLLDRFLTTIVREVDRLSNLVGDLTQIVRISSGITMTEKADCDITDVVLQAVEVVRPLAKQKGIEINVDMPEKLVVYCDGTQMIHAVRNLVDNAVKYTPEGGKVWVSAGVDGERFYVRVKDTGIGIPQGEVRRIFERFYRVDKARSRQYGGTGLGLSIVKEIVDAHGGEVCVETELGKGSTFTIFIPLTKDHAQCGSERTTGAKPLC